MEKIRDVFWSIVAILWLIFGRQSSEDEEEEEGLAEVSSGTVARPKCPFYGFVGMQGMMMDNKGNACALTSRHAPCSMEMVGKKPCWDSCLQWNHGENKGVIKRNLSGTQVFPAEDKSENGVPGHEWFKRIMGRKFP